MGKHTKDHYYVHSLAQVAYAHVHTHCKAVRNMEKPQYKIWQDRLDTVCAKMDCQEGDHYLGLIGYDLSTMLFFTKEGMFDVSVPTGPIALDPKPEPYENIYGRVSALPGGLLLFRVVHWFESEHIKENAKLPCVQLASLDFSSPFDVEYLHARVDPMIQLLTK